MLNKTLKNKSTILVFIGLIFIAGLTHAINMFHYPYYENDEGTYMSQAWSLLKMGKLAPYTYWYDHAPGGWILIAFWVFLTGGFFTFGASVNSGRVLMLIIHIVISACVFVISRRVFKGRDLPGAIAILIFSLSPLGIYFQRRVLLDNLMIFWVFASLFFVIKNKVTLVQITLSAVCFAFAVLTKENAIFFAPILMQIIWAYTRASIRRFALVKWCVIVGSIISLYFLYALLNKEFFPIGFMGDTTDHVSLLSTLKMQYSRGNNFPFWSQESDFYKNLLNWIKIDPFIVFVGILSTVINLVTYIKDKKKVFIPLMSCVFWLFLLRGKLVINFYITPIIPILALNIGLFIEDIINFADRLIPQTRKFSIAVALLPIFILLFESTDHFIKDETSPQLESIEWVKANLSPDTKLVIDDSIYVDLHEQRFPNDKVFPFADWSWKVEKDPEIYQEKLKGNWQNIEYIVLSHEMLKQIKEDKFNFIQQGLDNSFVVADWTKDSSSYIDVENYLSTNGDWMAIYKVNDSNRIALSQSWRYYKENFIHSYGQVIDPASEWTTSEGQSYALLRAVWQNDKRTFDGVWKWTKDHLQHRIQDNLISWLWIKDNGEYKLGDSGSASDADIDIAMSLLFAAKRWKNKYYYEEAKLIIEDIWKYEVKRAGNRYILLPGVSGFEKEDSLIVNPSYFSPATYRIFAKVDPENMWLGLANDSYALLNELGNISTLPPNWITVSKQTGQVIGIPQEMSGSNEYGYDAFRIFWRIGLDKEWFNTKDAQDYLKKYENIFDQEIEKNGKIAAVYSLDGTALVDYVSSSTTTAPFIVFSSQNNRKGQVLFNENYKITDGYWGEKNNYYDQNWAWFSTAYYHKLLPNLWDEELFAKY